VKRIALSLVLVCATAHADTSGARWLREHGTLEWVAAAGGWRTGLSPASGGERVPGFEALAGGTELTLGLEVYGGLAIILNGRFLGGEERGSGGQILDGSGGIGLQLRASDWVRLRAGAAAGQLRSSIPAELRAGGATELQAITVGGWLAASIDLFALGGHVASSISLRLDVDAMLNTPAAPVLLPDQTLALSLGLGFRY
jgi:hypothetical protein